MRGCAVLGHKQTCTGVGELSVDFDVGQARIDRRDRGSEPPDGEQNDHELDPVRQLEGDDIARPHAEVLEVTRRASDAVQQLRVRERLRPVGDRGQIRVEVGAMVG